MLSVFIFFKIEEQMFALRKCAVYNNDVHKRKRSLVKKRSEAKLDGNQK